MNVFNKIYSFYQPILLQSAKNYDHETNVRKVRNTFASKVISATKAIHRALPGCGFREKSGPVHMVKMPAGQSPKLNAMLEKFKSYSVFTQVPFDSPYLPDVYKAKGIQLISQGNPLAPAIKKLIERADKKHATTFDYGRSDWAASDLIKYHLTQDHFILLTELFNTPALNSIATDLKQKFGIDYKEAVIAEILAKSIAPTEGLDGKTLSLPIKNASGVYALANYKIRLHPLGDSLPCYILESADPQAAPWLVIRGTETHQGKTPEGKEIRMGSSESRMADYLDQDGISEDVLTKALVKHPVVKSGGVLAERPSLLEVFMEWKKQGKQVQITGHSLGGYLANDLANRMLGQVKTAYGFSAPGVSNKQEKSWQAKIQSLAAQTGASPEALARKIVNFDVEGDLVPGAGQKLIGLHLALQPVNHRKKDDPIHLHSWLNLNDNFNLHKIDISKENQKISRRVTETLRGSLSYVYRIRYRNSLPDWWVNRDLYRQIWKDKRQA